MLRKLSYICCLILITNSSLAFDTKPLPEPKSLDMISDVIRLKIIAEYLEYGLKEPEKAKAYYLKIRELNPNDTSLSLIQKANRSSKEKQADQYISIADYYYHILKDYQKSYQYYNDAALVEPTVYALEFQLQSYLNYPEVEKDFNKIIKTLVSLKQLNEQKCQDSNTTHKCANQSHNLYWASFYLDNKSPVFDIEKGEVKLLIEANRHSEWAYGELTYFHKCIKPNPNQYKYWHNLLFAERAEIPINCDNTPPSRNQRRY